MKSIYLQCFFISHSSKLINIEIHQKYCFYTAGFKVEEVTVKQGIQAAYRSCKNQGNIFSLQPPEGMHSHQYLDFQLSETYFRLLASSSYFNL